MEFMEVNGEWSLLRLMEFMEVNGEWSLWKLMENGVYGG